MAPELADPQRKAAAKAQLDAYIAGHHLKELRKSVGKTRAYAAALGGHVDVTISVGPHSVRVA
ncbi:hypothetical protein [Nonomuraea rubra]|uniref:hypothetical protein n=1 Tax=Nonomuraea rubra TaxID=46180 RepID=UPI0033FD32BE